MERTETFLDVYEREIAPRLMEMDSLIKTREKDIPPEKVCRVLGISPSQLRSIRETAGLSKVDAANIPLILTYGESPICELYKRELLYGSPYTYDAKAVSFIYNIPHPVVKKAFKDAGIAEATSFTLPIVFARMPA